MLTVFALVATLALSAEAKSWSREYTVLVEAHARDCFFIPEVPQGHSVTVDYQASLFSSQIYFANWESDAGLDFRWWTAQQRRAIWTSQCRSLMPRGTRFTLGRGRMRTISDSSLLRRATLKFVSTIGKQISRMITVCTTVSVN